MAVSNACVLVQAQDQTAPRVSAFPSLSPATILQEVMGPGVLPFCLSSGVHVNILHFSQSKAQSILETSPKTENI